MFAHIEIRTPGTCIAQPSVEICLTNYVFSISNPVFSLPTINISVNYKYTYFATEYSIIKNKLRIKQTRVNFIC